jgi:uncharacterized membrane protein YqjE
MGSLGRLLATVLTVGRTRAELMTVELQLELRRFVVLLVMSVAALLAGIIGLVLASFAVIVAFWDSHRLVAAIVVAVVFLAGGVITALLLAVRIRSRPRPFEATLAQLARDAETLRGGG